MDAWLKHTYITPSLLTWLSDYDREQLEIPSSTEEAEEVVDDLKCQKNTGTWWDAFRHLGEIQGRVVSAWLPLKLSMRVWSYKRYHNLSCAPNADLKVKRPKVIYLCWSKLHSVNPLPFPALTAGFLLRSWKPLLPSLRDSRKIDFNEIAHGSQQVWMVHIGDVTQINRPRIYLGNVFDRLSRDILLPIPLHPYLREALTCKRRSFPFSIFFQRCR